MLSILENLLLKFSFSNWVIDAIIDSIKIIPFLFIVFLLIEIIEFYYADKINNFIKKTGKASILTGTLAAIFPQCGFSVIAAGLYSKKIITRGCLVAIFLATSDEAIPILLATPDKINLVLPILLIKIIIALIVGYILEILLPSNIIQSDTIPEIEEGCCKHDIVQGKKIELLIHPIYHTINVFLFILVISLFLNYIFTNVELIHIIKGNILIQPILASLIGLIPNCAISIGITMMLIKGTITLGTAISGLLSNAGLGLLVLIKNNNFIDTVKIIFILLTVSIFSGILINLII